MRIVCQFSCGAASAVATKLTLAQYGATHDVQIVNAYVKEEHEDNRRFLADCEAWFGRKVTVFRDTKYDASIINVFRRKCFIKGSHGAPCTLALKRDLISAWQQPGDEMVFGLTAEESGRAEDFRQRFPGRPIRTPLIDAGLGKEDCKAMVERAGIVLPMMYRLGYENANCIGCVKGGMGYWRAIREDFPDEFEAMADVQDEITAKRVQKELDEDGVWFLRYRSGPRKDERFPLRELPPGKRFY